MSIHYDGFPMFTRNAIFNFINSNRTLGKTWLFKKRAFRRALKRGKKTLWVRRFKNEAKEAAAKFFTSTDLQKFCGIEMYDAETKHGNCKQVGDTFYIKRGKKWDWFLQIVALSSAKKIRGVDDVALDTIVFDEYRTTPEKYRQYRGNEVNDFIDIFFSVKREHMVRCFFLGNKESTIDPYFTYFGIPAFPDSFEGLRTFRDGAICVQFINNKQNEVNAEYSNKLKNLFTGTTYGRYIYENATKTSASIRIRKPPINSINYIQLYMRGQYARILIKDGCFYIAKGCDKSQLIYCDCPSNLPRHNMLTRRLKRFFTALENALIDGHVYYESQEAYELIAPFYAWLGI